MGRRGGGRGGGVRGGGVRGGSSSFDGGLESIHGGGGVKTELKNTCKAVHLLVKSLALKEIY